MTAPAKPDQARRRPAGMLAALAAVVATGLAGVALLSCGADGTATSSTKTAPVTDTYARLNVVARTGQRIVGGFPGRSIPKGLRKAIRKGQIGGVILFSRNIGTRAQIRKLTRNLQAIPRPNGLRNAPLLIMIDQEGGLVRRLAGAPQASAAEMGRRGRDFTREQGRKTGRNLANAGFNLNLAPVLDVARRGGVIDRTDRAFGFTPKKVGLTGMAFVKGLQAGGVATSAKHFPGIGKAAVNTDDAPQRLNLTRRQLERVDLAPFRRYVRGGGETVMVGTAIYPPFGNPPAAFNRRIVTGLLRRQLGFKGVTITDSLDAAAARSYGGPGRISLAGAHAGMDLLLFGGWETAQLGRRALVRGLQSGRLDRQEFRDSVNRIAALRRNLR